MMDAGQIIEFWPHAMRCRGCGLRLAIVGTRENWPPSCLNAACAFYEFADGSPYLKQGLSLPEWWPK